MIIVLKLTQCYINKLYKNNWHIILDIKWDCIYNYNHNINDAFKTLSHLLSTMNEKNIWLQFSFPSHIDLAQRDSVLSKFNIGYLLLQINNIPNSLYFVNIDLNNIPKNDIIKLKNNYPHLKIIGFTCKKKSHIKF